MRLNLASLVLLAVLACASVWAAADHGSARETARSAAERARWNLQLLASEARQARHAGRPWSAAQLRRRVESLPWPSGQYELIVALSTNSEPARTAWLITVRPRHGEAFLPEWDEYLGGDLSSAQALNDYPALRLWSADLIPHGAADHAAQLRPAPSTGAAAAAERPTF